MKSVIFLIGYRGAGKTTTARLLAERLQWNWCDADALLEERAGKTIRRIFQDEGEPSFRNQESSILRELAGRSRCVIATGGGVVLRPENRELLKTGVTIWLTAAPEVIWQRMQTDATTAERRPDLAGGGLSEIENLLHARRPFYQESADVTVDAGALGPEQVAAEILAWLQASGAVDITNSS